MVRMRQECRWLAYGDVESDSPRGVGESGAAKLETRGARLSLPSVWLNKNNPKSSI